jgi:hypothetical protein
MRVISAVVLGALIAGTPCLSNAQVTSPASDGKAQLSTADMQALIKAFDGHWSVNLRLEPSKETPNGLEGSGEENWHAGPQGLTFTDEETLTAGPHTVIVVGIFWRDPKTKDFHALDCSNDNPAICDLKGALGDVVVRWTGSELTVDEKELADGQMMTSRVEWSDITANGFTETGYLAPPGGPFQRVMTIHATRTAAR